MFLNDSSCWMRLLVLADRWLSVISVVRYLTDSLTHPYAHVKKRADKLLQRFQ